MLFRFLWLFDTAVALAALGGFIFYLFRGPVAKNMTATWLSLLAVLLTTIMGAGWLKAGNHTGTALLLLAIEAAPGIVYLFLATAVYLFRLKLKRA